jgi:HSP20 family protein
MTELARRSAPTRDLAAIYDDDWSQLDRMFDRLRQPFISDWAPLTVAPGTRVAFAPAALDIEDKGDSYEIRADLPGFPKESIDVRVQGSHVQVHAEQSTASEQKEGGTYLRRERSYRGFDRAFELPEPVASDKVSASYKDGVLNLSIPKAHPVAEKKITVA